ncbi:isochorismatase family protein [Bacillus sp. JCM 19041]|uniref:isochorismatase family protein n=1 Tax=Bacillus sp. JCM 19041 TaxID=1460637 RepID=UPI000A4173AE
MAPRAEDTVIQKRAPDSFYQTELDQVLKSFHIKHLILAGIQTEVCVDTTCRSARSKNYQVTLASDAHSTWGSSDLKAEQIVAHHNKALR